ncbi:unnamed protein product, partial [marine sediment metagenome]
IFNQTEFSMIGLPYYKTASVTTPILVIAASTDTNDDLAATNYIDNVIVTQNEP